jgi:hypothetical protein
MLCYLQGPAFWGWILPFWSQAIQCKLKLRMYVNAGELCLPQHHHRQSNYILLAKTATTPKWWSLWRCQSIRVGAQDAAHRLHVQLMYIVHKLWLIGLVAWQYNTGVNEWHVINALPSILFPTWSDLCLWNDYKGTLSDIYFHVYCFQVLPSARWERSVQIQSERESVYSIHLYGTINDYMGANILPGCHREPAGQTPRGKYS